MPLVYYLTAAGQEALSVPVREEQVFPLEVNFPLEYRRLLGMIEVGGHEEVLRGRLRRFPDQLIGEWLKELEDLKMIEGQQHNIDLGPDATARSTLFCDHPKNKGPARFVVRSVWSNPSGDGHTGTQSVSSATAAFSRGSCWASHEAAWAP